MRLQITVDDVLGHELQARAHDLGLSVSSEHPTGATYLWHISTSLEISAIGAPQTHHQAVLLRLVIGEYI